MTTETQPLPTDAATPPTHAADSVQDLQPVHDAVTIDLLNERVAYLERKLKEAGSVLEDAARLDWLEIAGPTSICVVIDRPHDSEVEVSTDDVTGYGKTLREALDAAREQGGAT